MVVLLSMMVKLVMKLVQLRQTSSWALKVERVVYTRLCDVSTPSADSL